MIDITEACGCIGQTVQREDMLVARPLHQLNAALNQSAELDASVVENGRHWLYFGALCDSRDLRFDGVPCASAPLPEIALPRRMWAGGSLHFIAPMPIGRQVRRATVLKSVYQKQGRSGPLVFAVVEHRISDASGLLLIEEQNYLYRDPALGSDPQRPVVPVGQWEKEILFDLNTLFRFSAITYNAHRIHFDRTYAMTMEGYRGAIVHGPLLAMLLMDEIESRSKKKITRFSYRGVSPLIDNEPALLCGSFTDNGAKAWACTAERGMALTAEAIF